MISAGPSMRMIIKINVQILVGAGFAALAWLAWTHASVLFWQLGLFAILTGMAAFGMLIAALGEIKSLVLRDLRVHAYRKQGATPKADDLVSRERMREAGLIQ